MNANDISAQVTGDKKYCFPPLALLAFLWGATLPLVISLFLKLTDGQVLSLGRAKSSSVGLFLSAHPYLTQIVLVGVAGLSVLMAVAARVRKLSPYATTNIALAISILVGSVLWLTLALHVFFACLSGSS